MCSALLQQDIDESSRLATLCADVFAGSTMDVPEGSIALTTPDRFYVVICLLAVIETSYIFRVFAIHVQAGSRREAQALTAFAFHEQFFDEREDKYIVDGVQVMPWHVEAISIPSGLSGLLDRLDAIAGDDTTEEDVVIPDNIILLFPDKATPNGDPPDDVPQED